MLKLLKLEEYFPYDAPKIQVYTEFIKRSKSVHFSFKNYNGIRLRFYPIVKHAKIAGYNR